MRIPEINIKQLLEAGVHLGHKTLRWNPKMKEYIFGDKNSIHIIDLTQTLELTKVALEKVYNTIANNGKILDLSEMIRKPYENVSIELRTDYNIEELKEVLKESGNTKINFIIKDKNKSFAFELEKTRKFDLTTFNNDKNKQYVKKISF